MAADSLLKRLQLLPPPITGESRLERPAAAGATGAGCKGAGTVMVAAARPG